MMIQEENRLKAEAKFLAGREGNKIQCPRGGLDL